MRNIDLIREVTTSAAGRWPDVLSLAGITVPHSPRQHSECPACGGTDRFRFDDGGRGSHFCNQCGAGDGLDLVAKVNHCDTTEAARLVADVLGIDYRTAETAPKATSQDKAVMEAERQHREQERKQQATAEQEQKRQQFNRRYTTLYNSATPGESEYLTAKGLTGFTFPMLTDGRLLVALTDETGTVTAAQTITATGDKRQVTDGTKRGAFYAVNAPEQPQVVIISEGLATTLTAHLMRPDALTVAAIDAGNLLPVAEVMRRRYSEAQIIIAADNDWHEPGECDEKGKPKQNIGVISAEKAAISVSGWVVTPPTHHKADWDDYRQQNGTEAATRAFTESLYQPKGAGMSVQLTAIEGGKKDRQQTDPLKPHIISRKDGVYWITPKVDKDSGEIINNESWLCSPLEVIGKGQEDREQYLILCWKASGQKLPVTKAIRKADIGEREGWRILKGGGVDVTTKPALRATLGDWLQRSAGDEMWSITPRSGWHMGAYIMPDGSIIGEPEQPIMFNGGTAAAEAYSVAGTAESWRDNVARLAAGNPFQMLAVGVALAAPMLPLVGADGFGIHLYAQSTAGKTTAEDLASSLYGEPERQRLTWYGTSLGIANEAEAHNHGLMALDEVDQGANPRHVYTSAYTLFNGKGKLQGDKDGGNRALKYWKTAVISTGERDIETYLKGAGIKVNAGQLVRLLNIPVSRPTELHGHPDGKAHADALKDAWQHNHGAAGRAWIAYLSEHTQDAIAVYAMAKARWRALIPSSYGEQVQRVIDRFAVIEASLVLGKAVTGWSEQGCRDALQHVFNEWVAAFGTGNKEIEQIIEQAEAFLSAYGMSRFAPLPYDPESLPIRDLAGYRESKSYGDPVTFYVLPATFKGEMAKGFDSAQFAKTLHESGRLKKPASGNGYQAFTPRLKHLGGIKQRTYLIVQLSDEE